MTSKIQIIRWTPLKATGCPRPVVSPPSNDRATLINSRTRSRARLTSSHKCLRRVTERDCERFGGTGLKRGGQERVAGRPWWTWPVRAGKSLLRSGAASPRPFAARRAARRRGPAEDQYVRRPRYAVGASSLRAGACDASGRPAASASECSALSGGRTVDCAGAGALWDARAPLVGAERTPPHDRRGDAPALAFTGNAGAFDSDEQGAQ